MNGKVKSVLLLCVFLSSLSFCAPSDELYLGIQFSKENTYRDTLNPSLDYFHNFFPWAHTRMGTSLLVSTKDVEGLIYRFDLTLEPTSWFGFFLKGAQRTHFPEGLSRTSLLGLATIQVSPWNLFSFFFSAGWYKRWTVLTHSSLIPFSNPASFSQYDWATEIGIRTTLTKDLSGLFRIATFDPWDVYNLNHPFIESAFTWGPAESKSKWIATFRYQLLLGFGRLDRLTFGLSYLLPW
ncbi:MAG: hypothetical protein ACKN9V_07175 [Pseudomonadota bacterium]